MQVFLREGTKVAPTAIWSIDSVSGWMNRPPTAAPYIGYIVLMAFALMSSGGKDSTLALDRARRAGMDVRYLVNIYNGPSQRVAFHGVHRTLIEAQAAACDLEPIMAPTDPDSYESVFLEMLTGLKARGVEGVLFGNIHLADVRAWFEDRVMAAGLQHVEPLWGDEPMALVSEFVERGFSALVVSVDLNHGASTLLGRSIDERFLEHLRRHPDIDPCGERGEYHSFVFDGPTFVSTVGMRLGATRQERGHRLVDLVHHPASNVQHPSRGPVSTSEHPTSNL
jgi:uncharacterized protein (TIGR00290 family)